MRLTLCCVVLCCCVALQTINFVERHLFAAMFEQQWLESATEQADVGDVDVDEGEEHEDYVPQEELEALDDLIEVCVDGGEVFGGGEGEEGMLQRGKDGLLVFGFFNLFFSFKKMIEQQWLDSTTANAEGTIGDDQEMRGLRGVCPSRGTGSIG